MEGTYKPQIHTHYLPHLSLSFARHTTSLNTTFELLSSDYTKSVHLQADRSIEFHTAQGCHYMLRLPRYGRDLKIDKRSAEILVPSVGVNENGRGEVYRLNIELGRFMKSFEVDVGAEDSTSFGAGSIQGSVGIGSVNTAAIAEESHNLYAFGTSLGTVEFWDPRARTRAGILQAPWQNDVFEGEQEITSLKFHSSGLTFAAGSSMGLTHLYDLRSSQPYLKRDQGYGFPIQDIIFLTPSSESRNTSSESKILTSDKRIIKIWNSRNGESWTSVEPAVDLHSVVWCKDSGMFLTANEGRQQHSFFIPQLGSAPRWCAFLDNLVEEMAEDPNDPNAFTKQKAGEVYDNYKFLTASQLDDLNLAHLIGTTSLLRPYMHGYFVAQRLYEEAKMIADPYIWEEQRAKKIKEKIDNERESRIRGKKKASVQVNRKLAEKLMDREELKERRRAQKVLENGGDGGQGGAESAAESKKEGLLNDARFAKLFQDKDFAIDETSEAFRLLNPSTKIDQPKLKERTFTAVEQEMLDEVPKSDGSETESQGEEYHMKPKLDMDSQRFSTSAYQKGRRNPQKPQMKVISSVRSKSDKNKSFGARSEKVIKRVRPQYRSVVGEKELTFAPEKKNKQRLEAPSVQRDDKARRSASGNVFRKM